MLAVFSVLTVIEMLVINLYTSYISSKKRLSPFDTWLYLFFSTVGFFILIFIISILLARVGYFGSSLFMLTGFLYIIPMVFLYDQPLKYTFIVMCSSWVYTLLAFSLSIRLAYLFPLEWLVISIFLFQTVFFALTLPKMLSFFKEKFIYILQNIENKTINSLLMLSILWFLLVFLMNYFFVEGRNRLLDVLTFIVIAANGVLSYNLFYSFVFYNKSTESLQEKTKNDGLTKLKNREGLYEDAQNKMQNNKLFTLIFLDLDDFKSINDTYGHPAGDEYLIEFAKAVKDKCSIKDGFYRMSGDEFVIMYQGQELTSLCSKLDNLEFIIEGSGVVFKGLSLGHSEFPTDGNNLNELLYLADLRMYQKKKEKHRNT